MFEVIRTQTTMYGSLESHRKVYDTDRKKKEFLIFEDKQWLWIPMAECRPLSK